MTMIPLFTPVDIPPMPWQIGYDDKILTIGSCFSDSMAEKLQSYYFQVTRNPFGTLYNPISIAHHMNDQRVAEADVLLLTFGTAWVFQDRKISEKPRDLQAVVDNCQKRPAQEFIRYRLTVDEIVHLWMPILSSISDKRVILTVSPIRHAKDGLHENQLSKATLLLAMETLTEMCTHCVYFPSYEILLDELRDYRFFANDLVHPSSLAVDYIWERMTDALMVAEKTKLSMGKLHQLWLDQQHRPLLPESEENKLFQENLIKRKSALKKDYPWI